MDAIVKFAEAFGNIVQAMGDNFAGMVVGIVPRVIVLMTIFFFISKAVGEEKVQKAVQSLLRWGILRYTIAPFLSALFFSVPMDFVPGKFLKENQKSAFVDSCLALHHPMLGFFPHVHAPEFFVYYGIAQGLEQLGLSLGPYNVRILLAGLVLAFVRGSANEWVFNIMKARRESEKAKA